MSSAERQLEGRLRELSHVAADPAAHGKHVDEPILALLRNGDQSEDLNDAISHVAQCPLCRAELTEGHVERKSVVVVAIEAPRASGHDLAKAAEGTDARFVERGQGRWAAVVDASKADKLRGELERPESSIVSRLAVGTPFEVPVEELRGARARLAGAGSDAQVESGTDAAEVQAWAQVARKPRTRSAGIGMSAGWVLAAVLIIAGAMGLAYFLATR